MPLAICDFITPRPDPIPPFYCSYSPHLPAKPDPSDELATKVKEAEHRWRESVERCEKLKQAYANLRQEHITLIRSNAETKNTCKLIWLP